MPTPDGIGARRAALQMLDAVLRRGEMLTGESGSGGGLAANDRALAQAIAGEALRRLPDLDRWIDSATRQRLPDDSKARMVLRLALAQKIGLHTPDHAVVATALPLVDGGPRKLVHGVLGALLRGPLPAIDQPRLPAEVEQRWTAQWGAEAVLAARRQIASRPALDLSFKSDSEARSFAAANHGSYLAERSVRVASANVAGLPEFERGDWWVQDLAASLPARLIPRGSGQVIDLCAAPGGKTMQLAAAGIAVTAVDASARRLQRLSENLRRTGLAATTLAADALAWSPATAPAAVLIDAPCSATGTFRRHPEVLYRARPAVIASMAQLQAALLNRSAAWLEPGGTIVFATCSLEREEGEDVVRAFLAGHSDFRLDPPRPGELPDFVTASAEGWVRIVPGLAEHDGGMDGFFFARLVRQP